MKQEDNKDLLFKDLCARIPYGVKVKIKYYDNVWNLLAIYANGTTYATRDIGYPIETCFEECKPYLFPLSSMTEEEIKEYKHLVAFSGNPTGSANFIEWLNAHHFDYHGLIEKGLAIDATGLNFY